MTKRSAQLQIEPHGIVDSNPIWTFGTNTCHVALWLRDDLQRHLRMARRQLGFQYVRAHGILNDDMEVVRPDGSFYFGRVIKALEALRRCGLRPFVELSSMPSALAANNKTLAAYLFRSAPPRNWTRWYELIRALTETVIRHFGAEEVRRWYFEVWNEPNINFWTGTMAQYFRLYDLAARAIKEVDPALRVGGPATARVAWIREFTDHVRRPSRDYPLDVPRCDFISTHVYPSDVAFVDSDRGEVTLQNSNIVRELFRDARRIVDQAMGPNFPLICGEWNSSAGPLAFNHDECNNAAFIVKTMLELRPACQGSLYWNLSDIYEECGFHYEPFHGGYGLITVNDVPKAAWHAFAFLREHASGEERALRWTGAPEGVGGLATVTNEVGRVLLFYYVEPDAPAPEPVDVTLSDIETRAALQVRRVEPGRGSAYETWVELGRPAYVNAAILRRLLRASRPVYELVQGRTLTLRPGTIAQVTFRLRSSRH